MIKFLCMGGGGFTLGVNDRVVRILYRLLGLASFPGSLSLHMHQPEMGVVMQFLVSGFEDRPSLLTNSPHCYIISLLRKVVTSMVVTELVYSV